MSNFQQEDQRPPSFPSYHNLSANYFNPVTDASLPVQNFVRLSHTDNIPFQPFADELAFHPTASTSTVEIPNQYWAPSHGGDPFYPQVYDGTSGYNSLGQARFPESLAQDSIQGGLPLYAAPSTLTFPSDHREVDHAIGKRYQLSSDGTLLITEISPTDEQSQYLPSLTDGTPATESHALSDQNSLSMESSYHIRTDLDLALSSIVNVGGGSWNCKQCNRVFRRKQRAIMHYLNKHRGVRLGCDGACGLDRCDKTFATQEGLDMHLNPTETVCPSCGRSLLRKNFIRHRRSHCRPAQS